MKTVSVVLAMTKETKGTYRFDADDPGAPVTSVYVRKVAFVGAAVPQRVRLTLEPAD